MITLIVIAFMSLSSGLGPVETTDCAEALRQLAEQGAHITHVDSVGGARIGLAAAVPDPPPAPFVNVAYTLQRREQTAILVCVTQGIK